MQHPHVNNNNSLINDPSLCCTCPLKQPSCIWKWEPLVSILPFPDGVDVSWFWGIVPLCPFLQGEVSSSISPGERYEVDGVFLSLWVVTELMSWVFIEDVLSSVSFDGEWEHSNISPGSKSPDDAVRYFLHASHADWIEYKNNLYLNLNKELQVIHTI